MKKILLGIFILVNFIICNKVLAYDQYKIGDRVIYNNDVYLVVNDSDKNTNFVTLLKEKSLTVDEINKYGSDETGNLFVNNFLNVAGSSDVVIPNDRKLNNGIAFFSRNTCSEKYVWNNSTVGVYGIPLGEVRENCSNEYNDSDVKKVVDNWASANFNLNDLISIDGYKARLLKRNDLKYDKDTLAVPNWISTRFDNKKIWMMDKNNDTKDTISVIYDRKIIYYDVFKGGYVNPVINLNKCSLGDGDKNCVIQKTSEDACTKKITKYREYQICSQVEYYGDKYYVIEKNDSTKDYITLLKVNPLTSTDINNNSNEEVGKSSYAVSFDLIATPDEYAFNINYNYNYSYIRTIIDNWQNDEFTENELVSIDGYKVRLLSENEINDFQNKDIFRYDLSYFLMNKYYNEYSYYDVEYEIIGNGNSVTWEYAIKPVINLKKNIIDNIENYQLGGIVSYKNNDYYIIKISDDYVTLFKKDALTQSQVNKYGERILTTYDNALALTNSWAEKFKNDLININGRTSGLLTLSDLFEKFSYEYYTNVSTFRVGKTDITPSCIDSSYWYWIVNDGKYEIFTDESEKKLSVGPYVIEWEKDNHLAVRPMLNVKKCAIDGGCYEEDVETECEEEPQIIVEPEKRIEKEPEKEKTIIEAENTFKTVSYILIIIGSLLIIGGYIFYKKIKKINN